MADVTPTCRYDHGNLSLVTTDGRLKDWAISTEDRQRFFNLQLFSCEQCGYSEFFDSNPGPGDGQVVNHA